MHYLVAQFHCYYNDSLSKAEKIKLNSHVHSGWPCPSFQTLVIAFSAHLLFFYSPVIVTVLSGKSSFTNRSDQYHTSGDVCPTFYQNNRNGRPSFSLFPLRKRNAAIVLPWSTSHGNVRVQCFFYHCFRGRRTLSFLNHTIFVRIKTCSQVHHSAIPLAIIRILTSLVRLLAVFLLRNNWGKDRQLSQNILNHQNNFQFIM